MKKDVLTVTGLFIAIVVIALWFSSMDTYVPYSSSIFSKYARYEPFSNSLRYSRIADYSQVDGPVVNHLISPTQDTLQNVNRQQSLDIYSNAPGSITENGWGYYNSMGSLVFDDNMKKMLTTRGMNAAGAPSQVAGSPV
jgi:hypothetical protein|uniref:Uncharacterized protein n=1 Tax=viral metagenome TaxID=1070528 RepID=A0A6C0DXJ2_9ZZZZ